MPLMFEDHDGNSGIARMRKTEIYALHAKSLTQLLGPAMEHQNWGSHGRPDNLGIFPADALCPSGAESLGQ